jgi:hypothetical protein
MFPTDSSPLVALFAASNVMSGLNEMRLREYLDSQSKKKIYDQGDIIKVLKKMGLFNADTDKTITEYTTSKKLQKKNTCCCIVL